MARYLATYGEKRVNKAVLISAVTPYLLKSDDNPEGVEQKVLDEVVEDLVKDRAGFLQKFAKLFYGVGVISHPVSDGVLDYF